MRTRFLLGSLFLGTLLACTGGLTSTPDTPPEPTPVAAPPPADMRGASALDALPPSDFTPATGRGTPPANSSGYEREISGPWAVELRVARSTDGGVTFTDTGEVVAQQAGVPSTLVRDGLLWVYYNAWQNGENFGAVAVRELDATGGWRYYRIAPTGAPPRYADAHAVLTDDGAVRLYYVTQEKGVKGVYSALGTDGIHFTQEKGARYAPGAEEVWSSPLVFEAAGTWLLYTLPDGRQVSSGKDGLTFSTDTSRVVDPKFFSFSGVKLPGEGYRIYGAMGPGRARSASSKDGKNWTLDSGSYWPTGDGYSGNGENGVSVAGKDLIMVYCAPVGGTTTSTATSGPDTLQKGQPASPPTKGAAPSGSRPHSGTRPPPNQGGTRPDKPRAGAGQDRDAKAPRR